ncbi:MAG: MFS transporter [Elusimicrobia bacterium]|nr:MFS transporter [Elusimicrobiota bacterium]
MNKLVSLFKPMSDAQLPLTDEQQIKKTFRKMRIKMFFAMYLGYVMYYFTRKNIAPVANVFKEQAGITIAQYGLMGTIAYGAYGVGKFISGMLADRCNLRFFMATGLFLSSVINLFFGFIHTFWIMAFFWGASNAAQSMGFPPVSRGLVTWFSSKERATKWTLWSSAHTVGTAGVAILAGALLLLVNAKFTLFGHQIVMADYISWRSVFYVPGILGILTSLYLMKALIDKPECCGLPAVDKYHNCEAPTIKTKDEQSYWDILKKYVLKNPYVWYLSIAYIFIYYIRFATLDWSTIFLSDVKHMDAGSLPFLYSIMPLIGMFGGIFGGWAADKFFNGRCSPINIGFLICLVFVVYGFYLFSGPQNIPVTAFFLGAVGFFVDGPQNLVGGVQVSRITVKESIGAACGFSGMFGYFGAMLSGSGAAFIIKHWGWQGLYASCAISAFISMLLVALVWNAEKAPEHRKKKA